MLEGQDTYCPRCGARNLRTVVKNGVRFAFCGESLEKAHTAFAVGVEKQPEQPRPAARAVQEE